MFARAASQQRVASTRDLMIQAPVKGWVKSGSISAPGPGQAEVLDNFFPTAQTARLRGGSTVYATIGTAIVRLLNYSSATDDMFATTATGIYDADRISAGGSAFADVTSLGSGDWSSTQMTTSGGSFMVAVNGSDYAMHWNGSDFYPINGAANNNVPYDALTAAFAVGETVTGGTSGATATILAIVQTSATAGTLRVGAITGGPYQDNEALTSAGGAATANGASASGSAIAITGVNTTDLSQVWNFKERLFFIEKNTMSAWYLPVKSIGGAAVEIPLGSLFRKGGSLLFGATWSVDSGSGLDDVCIFVTTNGEIAVYNGTDPSSASTWALAGVYEIAPPLNKHAWFKAGGDLAILTYDGIIPVSEALRKDRAALQAVAISYPIEDAWKDAVANASVSFPVTPTLWQSQAMLIIGVPSQSSIAYVANARTGAWCRYLGWDVRCGVVSADDLYFGTNAGIVMKAEVGGSDNGVSYTATYVPKFTDAGTSGLKVANHAGVTFATAGTPVYSLVGLANYNVPDFTAPQPIVSVSGDVWGTGVWGTFVWGGSDTQRYYTRWSTIRAQGYTISHALLVTALQTQKPNLEILSTMLRYENARAL